MPSAAISTTAYVTPGRGRYQRYPSQRADCRLRVPGIDVAVVPGVTKRHSRAESELKETR
ncbi:hypothetical protein GCM10023107_34630 [Actinoplanes octamycinicus]|nr:hypothetical protein Aoc01nite_45740 [Actinoplanes octamycinicus]